VPLLRGLRQSRIVQTGSGDGFQRHAFGLDLQAGVDRVAAVEALERQGCSTAKNAASGSLASASRKASVRWRSARS
jgi:hypothetical protein